MPHILQARSAHHIRGEINAPSGTQQAPTASPSPYISLPSSTIGLAVGITILGLILVGGLLACGIRAWRRKRQSKAAPSANSDKPKRFNLTPSIKLEEPQKPVFALSVPDADTAWVPQIRTHYGVPVTYPDTYLNGSSASSSKSTKKAQLALNLKEDNRPPPPAYVTHNDEPQWLSVPPPTHPSRPPAAPTPPADRAVRPHFSHFSVVSELNVPLASPARSESFAVDLASPLSPRLNREEASRPINDPKAPRRMIVISTFSPTMHDELAVAVGEEIYLLEEFHDGWCLVQRGDEPNAPRGVCPRFCLGSHQATLLQAINRNLTTNVI
ncbi:hypothetical protein BDN72DRAFT_850034 [Pluteus cervinus]|uniref:Uncharacterized protein n=1 Tax=Pluteus cervinus TaxID=181527 RepID=A0ACD3A6J5_9AGAR|nr:hypothetical protein BDN72DRAFT_850034 [Pluteus cervinus]